MATSENLGLYLPTRDDYISVKRDISDNMEIIDGAVGGTIVQIAGINGKISTQYDSTAFTSLDGIKTFLNSVNSSISDNEWKEIRFNIGGTNIDPFGSWSTYSGKLTRFTSTVFVCEVLNPLGNEIRICRSEDTWNIFSLNSNFIDITNTNTNNIATAIKNKYSAFQTGLIFGRVFATDRSGFYICNKASDSYGNFIAQDNIGTNYVSTIIGGTWTDDTIALNSNSFMPRGELSSADVNTYTTPGSYIKYTAPINGPSGYSDSFILLVFTMGIGGAILQILMPWSTTYKKVYMRTYVNLTWQDWMTLSAT